MKTDVEIPAQVPKKRRQIETLLDVHIATWLASEDLLPSERKRLEAEKARRKALKPDNPVGLLIGSEGVTPPQLATIREQLAAAQPTVLHHAGVSSVLHTACRALGVEVIVHQDLREVVRASRLVIGAPRSMDAEGSEVAEMIRYAKHRRVAARAVLPDGKQEA